jgi:hypothetical protein
MRNQKNRNFGKHKAKILKNTKSEEARRKILKLREGKDAERPENKRGHRRRK